MGRKKDFWELADSTILGRTKKNELLKIARNEHQQSETCRAEIELLTQKIADLNQLSADLRAQLAKGDSVQRQVLQDLLKTFDQQQKNHEQELKRLQLEAKDWEKVAQDYKDVVVNQQSELTYLRSVMQALKRFATMTPIEAGQAFAVWLFGSKAKPELQQCPACNTVIPSPDYQFCPHCGTSQQAKTSAA